MMGDENRPVVVGFDGSPSSTAALDAAAREAVSWGVPLQVVHAYGWPILYASLTNVPYEPADWQPPASVSDELSATARRVGARHPGLVVVSQVIAGSGGPVLVGASDGASMVVVGGRGTGGLAGLLAGSVARHVTSHAQCPVMVVRGAGPGTPSTGRVVVGVDGRSGWLGTLRFGCDWARRHGDGPVVAVHARAHPDPRAQKQLAEWVDTVRGDFPTIQIDASLVQASASSALLAASRSADVVVVGSRRRSDIAASMLGSVRQDLIRRSACAVVVVRGTAVGSGGDVDSLMGQPPGPWPLPAPAGPRLLKR